MRAMLKPSASRKRPYPYLGVKSEGMQPPILVVFFLQADKGVVVYSNLKGFEIGRWCILPESEFSFYEGEVALSN